MSGDRTRVGCDILAEAEEGMVPPEIFEGRFVTLVDLDLFKAGIALDVENAVVREQVGIEFLGATNVEDGVGFSIKLTDAGERKPGGGIAGEVAGAKAPAPLEAELRGK